MMPVRMAWLSLSWVVCYAGLMGLCGFSLSTAMMAGALMLGSEA